MSKITRSVGAVLAGLALLSLAAVSAPAAEPQGSETYVVRPGDTLSKIAGRIFGDVKRWHEILKANPQVTNANRIYPGDTLLVPVPVTTAPAVGTGGDLAARAGADGETGSGNSGIAPVSGTASDQDAGGAAPGSAETAGGGTGAGPDVKSMAADTTPAPPQPRVRPVVLVSQTLYRSAGSITEHLPTLAIVASPDDRMMLATDDVAIVNDAVSPGLRFTVVRADRRIFHPKTGVSLGWLIRVLGTAEVTCRDKKTSTVVLHGMRDAASIGDYLVPFDLNDVLAENVLAAKKKVECLPAGDADGMIVAFDEDRLTGVEQEFAYIDQGTASGITPGRRLTIYREIAPEGRVAVGELQVLRTAERTSTALITNSVRELKVGDLLRAR